MKTYSKLAILLGVFLLVLAEVSRADESRIQERDDYNPGFRHKIHGFTDTVYEKIGLITVVHPDQSRTECSGVLIAAKTVITSASCLITPERALSSDEYIERTNAYRNKAFAKAQEIYFTPGLLSPGFYMKGHFQATSVQVHRRFENHNNFLLDKNFAFVELQEDPELGHIDIMSFEDFKNLEVGSYEFIGHIKNRETAENEMWHDRLLFNNNEGKLRVINQYEISPFSLYHGTPILVKVGSSYRFIGFMIDKENTDNMARVLLTGHFFGSKNGPVQKLFHKINCIFRRGKCEQRKSYVIHLKSSVLDSLNDNN